jgi:uroporphyrinogen-III synthase
MNLQGMTVLVTRPPPAGQILCEAINKMCGTALYFPTLFFAPPENSLLLQYQIAKLDQYDWLIFISPQAVYASSEMIKAQWPSLPLRIAAVGAGTAAALMSVELPVSIHPKTQWNSEGLAALPQFQQVQNKKIALFCGADGRTWLATELRARGALVTNFLVYQRCMPPVAQKEINLLQEANINVTVCTSVAGMRNLKKLLPAIWPKLSMLPLIVISDRMQHYAEELGFKKILLAKNASHGAIIEALLLNIKG